MLLLPCLLCSILLSFHTALATPLNSTRLYLASSTPLNASSTWPVIPYLNTFGNVQLNITAYGRSVASAFTQEEAVLDYESLRRRTLESTDRFTGNQVTLYADVVAVTVEFIDTTYLGRVSRSAVANVMSALKMDAARYGARELGGKIGVEVHRSGVFRVLARVTVRFARVVDVG